MTDLYCDNEELKPCQKFSSQESVLEPGLHLDSLPARLSWLPEGELQIQILGIPKISSQ